MRTVYLTMQRSVMDYAAAAWQPWLSNTQASKLETTQNKALRLISGQYASTPTEALNLETGIEKYETVSKRWTAKAFEKAKRLEEDHPRYKALNAAAAPHRIKKRSSWRREAENLNKSLPLSQLERAPLPNPIQRPWKASEEFVEWNTNTELKELNNNGNFSTKQQQSPWNTDTLDTEERKKSVQAEAAIQTIDSYDVDTVIYTDGSCKGGTEEGGAAAIITTGSARNPIVLETLQKKGCRYTCSYDEERAAMLLAINWMIENSRSTDAVICTDSQALVRALENNTPDTREIREILSGLKGKVVIQWVPAHCNVPGNELADLSAKEIARTGEPADTPVSYNTSIAIINREIKDPPAKHHIVSKTYEHISQKVDAKIKTRKEAALIAQLRSGHCLKLAAYQHRINEEKSETCPRCNLEPETVKHWLECPATCQKRLSVFGDMDVPLGTLTKHPDKVLAFARETLLKETN
jgi:ribonuclease HI